DQAVQLSASGSGRLGSLAGEEALLDLFDIEVAADEDEAGFALLAVLPRALVVALDDHVDALHDIALGIALEGDNALQAQDVRAVDVGHRLDPGEEAVRVHLAAAQRNRLHRHVMDSRGSMMVVVVMIMIVIVVMMVMTMVVMPVVVIAIGTADMILMPVLQK